MGSTIMGSESITIMGSESMVLRDQGVSGLKHSDPLIPATAVVPAADPRAVARGQGGQQ